MSYNVTLKEIALKSGVSISTVSKALNDSHEISVGTKEKITGIAKSLNYKPNFFAKNLKKKENYIIGVILPDVTHQFFSNLLVGITEETSKREHRIMVYHTCNNPIKEVTYTKLLSGDIIDGLIIAPCLFPKRTAEDNEYLVRLSRKQIPMMVINKNIGIPSYSKVEIHGGLELGKELVSKLLNKIEGYNTHLQVS